MTTTVTLGKTVAAIKSGTSRIRRFWARFGRQEGSAAALRCSAAPRPLPNVIVIRNRQKPDAAQLADRVRKPTPDVPLSLRKGGAKRRDMLIHDVAATVMPSISPRSSRETVVPLTLARPATSACRRFREMRTALTIRPTWTSWAIGAGWHPAIYGGVRGYHPG